MNVAQLEDALVPSVLLVDDRPENLLALEGTLKPLKIRVVKARSGEEALLQLLRQTFAVILLDVQMPRLDGLQTAELIKQREQTRHIPLIFITALSRETAYVFKGYAHGAVDYLLKPIDAEILRAKVRVFCDLFVRGVYGWTSATIDGQLVTGFWTDPSSNHSLPLPAKWGNPSFIMTPRTAGRS